MKEQAMTNWRRGTPTVPGEYIASRIRATGFLRWWNGEYWSIPYSVHSSEDMKRRHRRAKSAYQDGLEWCGLKEKPEYKFENVLEPL